MTIKNGKFWRRGRHTLQWTIGKAKPQREKLMKQVWIGSNMREVGEKVVTIRYRWLLQSRSLESWDFKGNLGIVSPNFLMRGPLLICMRQQATRWKPVLISCENSCKQVAQNLNRSKSTELWNQVFVQQCCIYTMWRYLQNKRKYRKFCFPIKKIPKTWGAERW